MSWPTGDSILSGLVAVRFLVPPDNWIVQALLGACDFLQYANKWDPAGEVDPPEIAAVFAEALRTVRVQNSNVGQIVCFPADNMQYIRQDPAYGPSEFLKCEGQSLAKAAYPDLYGVIGDTFGATTATFDIPDLRCRAIVDAGSGAGLTPRSLGDALGEETHQLTVVEMPSHNHSTGNSLLLGTSVPPPLDALGPNPLPALTGSAGFDGAHNNMQPSLVLFYYIQVEP